jgi:hypothetical protein
MWMTLLKFALSVAVTAVSQIPAAKWAQLGVVIANWLQAVEDKLPAGNPLIVHLNAYRASRSKLIAPRSADEPWES